MLKLTDSYKGAYFDLVERMLRTGFRVSIISDETGLQPSTVRRIAQEAGIKVRRFGTQAPLAALACSKSRIKELTLFCSLFAKSLDAVGRDGRIEAIMAAHALYIEMRGCIGGSESDVLAVNDAYTAAYAYLRGQLRLQKCGCGSSYAEVDDQRIPLSCPFCAC